MSTIKLSDYATRPPKNTDRDEIEDKTKKLVREIEQLQELLYANRRYSLLIIFQGMDSSGKDGATHNIFKRCSPSGVTAYSFKKPTKEELSHDFLWRVHQQVPEKGMIKIFNRSHYEDILIQRVHNWIDEGRVTRRIQSINAFEELLEYDNETKVLKFYMHLSQERQQEKLQERIDEKDKNWKHNPNDWKESKLWDRYMECYEDAINRSSIPWHIVPVDSRWYRDYSIAKIVAETLRSFDLEWPPLPEE